MAKKNEASALIVSLLVTLGLIGAGAWLFFRQGNVNLGGLLSGNGSTEQANDPSTTGGTQGNAGTTSDALVSVSTFSAVPDIPSGLFNYGGSTTWAPIRGAVDPIIQSTHPQFQIRYTDPVGQPPGSSIGIQMLLDGQLGFSQSSVPLTDENYQQAQQRGFTLAQVPVAIEGIAIAVNPDLPVPGLTLDQLRNIYTGQTTNWSEVGGPNLPIVPISRSDVGGTVEFFISSVLGDAPFGDNVQQAVNTTQALRQLAESPGAIYYGSAPEVVPQCTIKPIPIGREPNTLVAPYQEPLIPPSQCPNQRNQINLEAFQSGDYPITRTLFVIIKQNGQTEQQAGETYANMMRTEEAAEALTSLGFVPLQ
ncbi:PstS family phosphate ABC transporter substrate-binding protein [Vacuolonema iberomarrocanum]|uniref:PstS family phosphate ABC transporter substrate-binding protein n=1 Tax=Vacuolonema iberomarrocanum TaxID=3454632 RepID=UPI0019EAE797|nr:substrate-binding domain-containing protein [filamentous cyanobacterium LEGE 07170]